ncbi:hypothetical protein ACS0TY_017697 [Phlomoides rotata]
MASISGKKKGEGVGVLGLLRIVVAATMGCFFGCFRMKDSRYHPVRTPKKEMASRNKNALSSLFCPDEPEKDSDLEKGQDGNPLQEEFDVRELKNEAKFLKACGTLLETPVEFRKVSGKCADISTQREESSKFNSWIPSSSIDKLKFEKQPDESLTPFKVSGEWVTGAGFLVGTPSSSTAGHSTGRYSTSSNQSSEIQNDIAPKDVPDNETQWSAISSVSSGAFPTAVKRTNKSVRFEFQSDSSRLSSGDSSRYSKDSESPGNFSVSKPSPYSTPLKLTDEMQTPGTVYPAYVNNNNAGGKTTMIRSQYVYSVLNPTEHLSHWKQLKEEKSDSSHLSESLKPDEDASTDGVSADIDGKHSLESSGKVNFVKTPGDRPILGMVAAHWNDEEEARISPKWWDGNGIPNSTTKYKEDQKVSWHATPFEERLEKALSEDNFVSWRRRMSGSPPLEMNEIEESDTALSSSSSYASFRSNP